MKCTLIVKLIFNFHKLASFTLRKKFSKGMWKKKSKDNDKWGEGFWKGWYLKNTYTSKDKPSAFGLHIQWHKID
jgi:hypothetical protein